MATTAVGMDGQEFLPALDIDWQDTHSRLTVAFRILLAIPQFIVLFFVGIAAFVLTVIGWFAALFTGRLPDGIAGFLAGYVAWNTRVYAYVYLLVDDYPPFAFDAPRYPVRIELRPGPLNRLAVLFRVFLMIPAAIVSAVAGAGLGVFVFLIWLIVLISGRMPPPVFEASAAVLRYGMRLQAYTSMLTSAYPKRLFGDDPTGPRISAARPLVLSSGARVLLIVFLVLGVVSEAANITTQARR